MKTKKTAEIESLKERLVATVAGNTQRMKSIEGLKELVQLWKGKSSSYQRTA